MASAPDPFSAFRASVALHFTSVAADFGLEPAVERIVYREIYIEFTAPSRRLRVAFEYGGCPWVEVAISHQGAEQRFGLHTLEEDVEAVTSSVERIATMPDIGQQVHALADLTRRYAAPLLSGDTSRLQHLRLLRAKAVHERNRELTGTRSGAAPVDRRPTLSELFAAARDAEFPADVRLFCVYQAVLDHEYSVGELSEFLSVSRADVQRIIDAFDNTREEPVNLETLRRIVGVGD